jgi:hypothetical protein
MTAEEFAEAVDELMRCPAALTTRGVTANAWEL